MNTQHSNNDILSISCPLQDHDTPNVKDPDLPTAVESFDILAAAIQIAGIEPDQSTPAEQQSRGTKRRLSLSTDDRDVTCDRPDEGDTSSSESLFCQRTNGSSDTATPKRRKCSDASFNDDTAPQTSIWLEPRSNKRRLTEMYDSDTENSDDEDGALLESLVTFAGFSPRQIKRRRIFEMSRDQALSTVDDELSYLRELEDLPEYEDNYDFGLDELISLRFKTVDIFGESSDEDEDDFSFVDSDDDGYDEDNDDDDDEEGDTLDLSCSKEHELELWLQYNPICPPRCVCRGYSNFNLKPQKRVPGFNTITPLYQKVLQRQALRTSNVSQFRCCELDCCSSWYDTRISARAVARDYPKSDLHVYRFSWGDWKEPRDEDEYDDDF